MGTNFFNRSIGIRLILFVILWFTGFPNGYADTNDTSLSDGDEFVVDDIKYAVISKDERTCKTKEGGVFGGHFHITGGHDLSCYYAGNSGDNIVLPSNPMGFKLVEIGRLGFVRSNIKTIEIPEGVKKISSNAFWGCENLVSVTIPASVTEFGDNVFKGCIGLQEIYLYGKYRDYVFPSQAKIYTFRECYSGSNAVYLDFLQSQHIQPLMTSVIIDYSERFSNFDVEGYEIKSLKITYPSSALADIPIPLRNDGKYEVTLTNNSHFYVSMVYFDPRAERDVTTTWGPYVMKSSETIGAITYYCRDWSASTVSVFKCDENVVGVLNIPESVEIDGRTYSVTRIGNSAFNGCSNLTSMTIPSSVTNIGRAAFMDCSSLTSMTIPGSVTSIGDNVFSGCTGLQEIYLYGKYSYDDFPSQAKVYTFRECYSCSNATYLDFLQPQHITPLMAGVAIDYSERFNSFGVEGYEIKSLNVTNEYGGTIAEIPLRNDGKYLVKLPKRSYNISMVYFDPRAGRDITTTFGPYKTQAEELLTIKNITTTETTVSFDYEANEDASTDFSEFKFYAAISNGGYFSSETITVTDKKGRITLDKLWPGSEFQTICYVYFKDGREYGFEAPKFTTKDIVFSADVQRVTPTTIELEWSYDAGDAADHVKWVTFEAPDSTYRDIEGNRFYYCCTSLPRNSRVEVEYRIGVGMHYDNRTYKKTETFTLPELVLTTVNAKATSNDCAIICAETNMSEMETSCGFEWRRYDAPDMVPSTFVNCPVNNGMMAGKLMGLSSNTYYKYRPFYEDMNGNKTYGEWTGFITADAYVYFEPTVYTYVPTRVARTSAVITGYALGGSDDVIEQGFEYSVVTTSRAAGEPVRVPATGTRMTATLTNLLPGTTYAVRAYATTAKETTYGEEQRFTTEGEEQDAIKVVEVEEAAGFDVYTLSGVCVRRNATDMSGLRPGIYIANGHKFIVR